MVDMNETRKTLSIGLTEEEALRLARALAFACEKHEGQERWGGAPFITHPIAVASMAADDGYGLDMRIAALFHDLLEDTDATEEELRSLGGETVLSTVKLLTKFPGYMMQEYVDAIARDPMARKLKFYDRLHNLRSAHEAPIPFRIRYIRDSERFYAAFGEEIVAAIEDLKKTVPAEH